MSKNTMKKTPRVQLSISGSGVHADDRAVHAFALEMCAKLAKKRADGHGGWEGAESYDLAEMFVEHVVKGDPVDLANFAMFLGMRGKRRSEIRRALRDAMFNYVAVHTNVHLTTAK